MGAGICRLAGDVRQFRSPKLRPARYDGLEGWYGSSQAERTRGEPALRPDVSEAPQPATEGNMLRGLALWLLGIPIPIIILLLLFLR